MKKIKKSKPSTEMLTSFKEISKFGNSLNFILVTNSNQNQGNNSFNNINGNKQQKIKMPYKMYMGIKKSFIKKHDKEREHRQKVKSTYNFPLLE